MKRVLIALSLLLFSLEVNAQFTNGQVLTAQALNAALAGPNITSGTINGATVGLITPLAGQFTNLTVTGTLTAPVTIGSLVPQAANTVIGNFTGSTASPTANSVPNCSGISSALTYTGGSGFSCNGTINALTLGGATFASPGPIGSTSTSTGSFSSISTPSATIGGGTIDGTTVGATSASTGKFTNLTYTGTFTPAAGTIALTGLATEAANTIVANATSGVASPTAISVPSCSTTSSALNWTNGTGLSCNTTINASSLGGTVAASYALLASPTFTGTPAAPTAAATTNTTQLATTAMVNSAITGGSLGGSFTTLSATGAVSGAGFTSRFSTPGPIGNTTASTGAFTTITASSTITPSTTAGIVGTTLGDNANAGSVGEVFTANSTGITLSSGANSNITSVTLTAGDFDCSGTVVFVNGGTSSVSSFLDGISTTSASLPNEFNNGRVVLPSAVYQASLPTPLVRENVTSSTQVFLVAQATWTTATITADGLIRCRRVR